VVVTCDRFVKSYKGNAFLGVMHLLALFFDYSLIRLVQGVTKKRKKERKIVISCGSMRLFINSDKFGCISTMLKKK